MTIQQNLPVVPPEIFELIIEQLAASSDFASIRSLCLVDTSFVHPCRKEIFGTLEIKPEAWADRPINQFMPVYSGRPTIASYIRDLRLWLDFDDHSLEMAVSLLGSQYLKNVQSFELGFEEEISFSPPRKEMMAISDRFFVALCNFITTNPIKRLDLCRIHEFPFTFFNYLPHLRELLLYNVGFAQTPVPDFLRKCPTSVPQLTQLHLKWNISGAMLDILNQRTTVLDLSQLQDLMVYLDDEQGKEALSTRMFSISQGLKKVHVGGPLPQINRLKHFAENIQPKSLHTLKTLEFTVVLEESGLDPLASIIDELSAISGQTTLENLLLTIVIDWDIRCSVSADVWGRLENVLTPEGSYSALKRVNIEITVTQCDSADYKEFMAQLEDVGRSCFQKLEQVVNLTFEVSLKVVRHAEG